MPESLCLHAFVPHSRANGPGLRAVVWVAGCSLHCEGCFNPATHDPAHGQVVSVADLFGRIVSTPGIEGVTLTGGEPFQQPGPVLTLLRRLRAETKLSTLLFTGFWPHEIARMPFRDELPHLLDVLIAGRYVQDQRIASGLIGSASKTVFFYTQRYQTHDLAVIPPAEVIITSDGAIELPLPGREARERYLTARIAQDQITLAPGLTAGIIAQITGGLSLLQIEDVLFRGMGAGILSREHITERKQTIIRQEFAEVLEINDARFDLTQVGGYEHLKAWLHTRVIGPWQQGALRIGGLLLSGPPGTGKTQLAEALAGSAGVPFVVFRLSKILGQYIGNSERNLERALHALLSLSPVLCFIDELDQTLRRGDQTTTSGVDNRLFARLLEFLEDPSRRGKVLIAGATNRPDLRLLPPALRNAHREPSESSQADTPTTEPERRRTRRDL